VFVPSAKGRLRQLIISLIVIALIIAGLLLTRRVPVGPKRIAVSVAVVALGVLVFVLGLTRSGLTPPAAPVVTVIESYHLRGEFKVKADVPAGKGKSLSQAIFDAGDFTKLADKHNVVVIRRNKTKLDVDMTTAEGKKLAARPFWARAIWSTLLTRPAGTGRYGL